ncbi:MAG: CHAD domain-containing protein [Thermogutta sp.]
MGQDERLLISQVAVPYIRRHLRRLLRALEGVPSAKDPESVHQTRVACRRLRTALKMFRELIGPKRADRWRRALRDLAAVFSSARDLDVEIASTVTQMAEAGDPTVMHGFAFWLSHLEEQRFGKQRQLIRAVRIFRKTSAVEEMNCWIRSHRPRRAAPDNVQRHWEISIPAAQQQPLARHLEKFLRMSESVEDPTDIAGHHAMRIAAKKLRYSLEALAPALGVTHEVAIEALCNIQSLLGEIHDYDVWIDRIDEVLQSLPQNKFDGPSWLNPSRFSPGLIYLRDKYRHLREVRFRQLVDLWHDEKVQGIWKTMRESGLTPIPGGYSKKDMTNDGSDVVSHTNEESG